MWSSDTHIFFFKLSFDYLTLPLQHWQKTFKIKKGIVQDSKIPDDDEKCFRTSSIIPILELWAKMKSNNLKFQVTEESKNQRSLSLLKFCTMFWSYTRSNKFTTSLLTIWVHNKGEYLGMWYSGHTKQQKVKSSFRITQSEDEKLLSILTYLILQLSDSSI